MITLTLPEYLAIAKSITKIIDPDGNGLHHVSAVAGHLGASHWRLVSPSDGNNDAWFSMEFTNPDQELLVRLKYL
jgi:hypothetical protein